MCVGRFFVYICVDIVCVFVYFMCTRIANLFSNLCYNPFFWFSFRCMPI